MNTLLQIGDVAAETGLTVDAIRFYEREHLLRATARSDGGFRLFSQSDVDDLGFIRNAQKLGFSLQEVRELMALRSASHADCQQVEQLLEHKISAVRAKIAALRSLERELQRQRRIVSRISAVKCPRKYGIVRCSVKFPTPEQVSSDDPEAALSARMSESC